VPAVLPASTPNEVSTKTFRRSPLSIGQTVMTRVRLINPNTSAATTRMMAAIARLSLPASFEIEAVTAPRGVSMIVDIAQLHASVEAVVEMATDGTGTPAGIIIGAFGDPGIEAVRARVTCPVVGICEAAMLAASAGGRRFGIATVTPDLVASFKAKAADLGLAALYTGTRLTPGDPRTLASDPPALEAALAEAVRQSFDIDGADAVIIGGGPLGQAAASLQTRFLRPVIAPIPAAVARLVKQMASRSKEA
jgi:Asp/Glu/hydantoin racemase